MLIFKVCKEVYDHDEIHLESHLLYIIDRLECTNSIADCVIQ